MRIGQKINHTFIVVFLLLINISFAGEHEQKQRLRLAYNNPGLVVDLGVGLWANPFPVDWDKDGDSDLLVSTADVPYNGLYYFENTGNDLFAPAQRVGPGKKKVAVSYPSGQFTVCSPELHYAGFREHIYENPLPIAYEQDFYSGRANQWKLADYDGDGDHDLIVGVSDWRDYGWDDAYDQHGNWTHGKLHGFVYWMQNLADNSNPKYAKAQKIEADGEPIDVYGWPSPNLVDWDNDGDLDMICGEFLDKITFFENTGSRSEPKYARGTFLKIAGETLHLELEMMQVVVYDWDMDDDPDIIVGKEDGRVVYIENSGIGSDGLPRLKQPVYFKQQAEKLKSGALVTPCSFDWDGDGDEDLVCGNTAGFIEWFENLDGGDTPKWSAVKRVQVAGNDFRIMAGKNMSIQGPAEAKWGYTVPYVADWDMDGLPDILFNSIIGKIEWLKNVGSRSAPRLAPARPVKVAWSALPPKPAWNWWNPEKGDLVVQWRTRPIVLDLNRDGLNDLVCVDHEGYLTFYERDRVAQSLILKPGKRTFLNDKREALRLNSRHAGKSGRRKIDLVDWDNDGDLDLLINSANITLYENIGSENEFVFLLQTNVCSVKLAGHTTSPTTVDWNRDGVRDLLIGAEDGFLYYIPRPDSKKN